MNNTYISTNNYEYRALAISFALHVSVIGFYLLFLYHKPMEIMPSKTIVLEISNIERVVPKPLVPTPPIPEVVQKIDPIKPIEQIKPQPKLKKEVTVSPALPHNEVSVPVVEQVEPVITQEVVSLTPISTGIEPYIKTDFEIIRDKVLASLIYPSVAKRMGWNGVVHVALVINTQGRLVSASIHQSSGRQLLDDAALDAANKLKAEELPKPQSLSTVILPIAFKLK